MKKRENTSDSTWVEQFKESTGQKRKEAFSELYRRRENGLRWFFMRLTQNKKLANDLAQETFKEALNSLEGFQERSSFKTWLYGIASNIWKSYLDKRRPDVGLYEENIQDEEGTPDQITTRREQINKLSEAMNQLSEKLRVALVLVRFEGMKYREAADALDISLSALKLRVHRAIEKLRQLLGEGEKE